LAPKACSFEATMAINHNRRQHRLAGVDAPDVRHTYRTYVMTMPRILPEG
jgi:hypothetical protein